MYVTSLWHFVIDRISFVSHFANCTYLPSWGFGLISATLKCSFLILCLIPARPCSATPTSVVSHQFYYPHCKWLPLQYPWVRVSYHPRIRMLYQYPMRQKHTTFWIPSPTTTQAIATFSWSAHQILSLIPLLPIPSKAFGPKTAKSRLIRSPRFWKCK